MQVNTRCMNPTKTTALLTGYWYFNCDIYSHSISTPHAGYQYFNFCDTCHSTSPHLGISTVTQFHFNIIQTEVDLQQIDRGRLSARSQWCTGSVEFCADCAVSEPLSIPCSTLSFSPGGGSRRGHFAKGLTAPKPPVALQPGRYKHMCALSGHSYWATDGVGL